MINYQEADAQACQALADAIDQHYTFREVARTRQTLRLADFGSPIELLVEETEPGKWHAKVLRDSEMFFDEDVDPKAFAKELAELLKGIAQKVRQTLQAS